MLHEVHFTDTWDLKMGWTVDIHMSVRETGGHPMESYGTMGWDDSTYMYWGEGQESIPSQQGPASVPMLDPASIPLPDSN